jgi:predicted RNA binding protein YcfA (HicA-like mRNA interferase family)
MRLPPVSRADLIQRLRALGWAGPISGKKHQHMVKGAINLTIPNPRRGDIGIKLLKIILKEAGISTDEWLRRR